MLLLQHGFIEARQRDSHALMQNRLQVTTTTLPIPMHAEIRMSTLQSIIRQSGLPRSIFENQMSGAQGHRNPSWLWTIPRCSKVLQSTCGFALYAYVILEENAILTLGVAPAGRTAKILSEWIA